MDYPHIGGIRRVIKVYGGLRDPKQERKRQRFTGPIRLPHKALATSVKRKIKGQI